MLDGSQPVLTEDFWISSGSSKLSARLYRPMTDPRVAVVIHCATGVPRDYYQNFAHWLAAERGYACLTYDYSDFGHSLTIRMQDSQVTMADWALVDMPAARAEMRRRFPDAQQWSIGHSLGGMLTPLAPDVAQMDRMICVCSGLVTLPDHPWPYRALATLFWYGHVPLLVKTLGYLPGRATGFGADLPARVYWQWREWCTAAQNYLPEMGKTLPVPTWSEHGNPVDLFAVADDQLASPKSVWRLADLYGPDARRHLLTAQEFGAKELGHIGVFARRNAAVWPRLIAE